MLSFAISKKMAEPDKILHIQYSAGIMLVSAVLLPIVYAFIFTFVVGLLKECWDHYYGSGFCLYDMLANMIGIVGSIAVVQGLVFIF